MICPACNQPIYVGYDGATECGGEGDGVCDTPDEAAHLRAQLETPILDDPSARQYLALLVRQGWTVHPEESAFDADLDLDRDTRQLLDDRMCEVWQHLDGDPCAVLLDLARPFDGGASAT